MHREFESWSRREVMAAGTGFLATPFLLGAHAGPLGRRPDDPPPQTPMTPHDGLGPNGPPRDPRHGYPKPPFKRQQQEPPGLASKMEPRPDHGETSYRGTGRLIGRKALITGGDSGIGRAAAIAYAREGADVAFGYLPVEEPDAKEVVELIRGAGRKAVPLPGDIRDETFCRKLVNDAVRELGGLDILVNNAAQQVYRDSVADITTSQMESVFRTNVFAIMWITQAALPHLKPGSAIICTVSIVAYDPPPGILDYAMSKGAVAIFVKGLSKQLIEMGIRVNGVAPGPIWTPLQPSGGQSPEKLVEFGANTPYGRPGQPVELASTFVLLAANESNYVSGEIHGVTGGHFTA